MRATASLAPLWPAHPAVTVRQQPRRSADHPITRDPAALERALIAILESAKLYAAGTGRLPEQDLLADAFRRQHGRLAAMLNSPIEEMHVEAVNMLVAHGMLLLPPGPFNEMAERITARTGHLNRYAADRRPRH